MNSPKSIECGEHGQMPWNGEVTCCKCERVFTTHDVSLATHAPMRCPCGARLMPKAIGGGKFSARLCCSECFAQRVQVPRGSA